MENSAEAEQTAVDTTSPENIEALLEAARYGDIDDLTILVSTALHMACANGYLDIVEYLISKRVELNPTNAENNTPLHWACLNGHVEVVKKLILAGASVSALNSYERTPMDEAVSNGKMDVIDAINTAVAQLELAGISVS
uniref:Uncharacterized protein n=1 Tax=Cannabis sativa TaxID=3483 RepID=A0A803Q0G6_CANSA